MHCENKQKSFRDRTGK